MIWILLLIATAGLLSVGVLLVQIPLHFTGKASLSGAVSMVFFLLWGPVLVFHEGGRNGETAVQVAGRTLYQQTGNSTPPEKKDTGKDEIKGEKNDQKKRINDLFNLLPGLYRPLRTIFHAISLDHWFCIFRCGTGDPATTGELYGCVQGLREIFPPCPKINLQMTPEFNEVIMEGETELAFRIDRPFLLAPQVVHIARCVIHQTKPVKIT